MSRRMAVRDGVMGVAEGEAGKFTLSWGNSELPSRWSSPTGLEG
jgi:hypothetical protein